MPPTQNQPLSHTAGTDFLTEADSAVKCAAAWLKMALRKGGRRARTRAAAWHAMAADPQGRSLLLHLIDLILRAADQPRAARLFHHLIDTQGMPHCLPRGDRFAFGIAKTLGRIAPRLFMPMIQRRLRRLCAPLFLADVPSSLQGQIDRWRRVGIGVCVALPGETAGSDEQAENARRTLLRLLGDSVVRHVSFKLSELHPHLEAAALDSQASKLRDSLAEILRTAAANPFQDASGHTHPRHVTLDASTPADWQAAFAALRQCLEIDEFQHQSNTAVTLPADGGNPVASLADFITWADDRAAKGCPPVTLRLLSGNEKYHSRALAHLIATALNPDHSSAIRLRIASANPLEIALAHIVATGLDADERIEFDVPLGITPPIQLPLAAENATVWLHAPLARRGGTAPPPPLAFSRLAAFTEPGTPSATPPPPGSRAWEQSTAAFLEAIAEDFKQTTYTETTEPGSGDQPPPQEGLTDWTIAANREWIEACKQASLHTDPLTIPVVVCGESTLSGDAVLSYTDPSRPGTHVFHLTLANEVQVAAALRHARLHQPQWADTPAETKAAIADQAATLIAAQRGPLITAMIADAGRTATEADTEVASAIHLARRYADMTRKNARDLADLAADPIGTVVIVPSRKLPLADPLASTLAALLAGNAAILKPPPESALTCWHMARLLWEAGIPRDILQFTPSPDRHIASKLIVSREVAAVALTGSRATATQFKKWNNYLRLHASATGGGSMLITGSAHIDQAIDDLIHAAFSQGGQTGGAIFHAIVDSSLYHDQAFLRRLAGAASSLSVGPAWEAATVVTPIPRDPQRAFDKAGQLAEKHRGWLLEPRMIRGNPKLWTPGIRFCAGLEDPVIPPTASAPLLGLIEARSLEEGIAIQNDPSLGLVAALHSLDQSEIDTWLEHIEAAAAFVNRRPASHDIHRQFSVGWKQPPAAAAANLPGLDDLATFARWEQAAIPEIDYHAGDHLLHILEYAGHWLKSGIEKEIIAAAAASYQYHWDHFFSIPQEPDPQGRLIRYRPLPNGVLIRFQSTPEASSLCGILIASLVTDTPVETSLDSPSAFADALGMETVVESNETLAARIASGAVRADRLRAPMGAPLAIHRAAANAGIPLSDAPVVANGRIELLQYLRQQTVCLPPPRPGSQTHF